MVIKRIFSGTQIRILISLFLLFSLILLAGCSATHKAKRLYEKGMYFESVEVVAKELDHQRKFPEGKDATTMLNILHVGTLEFERCWKDTNKSADTDYKISEYKELLRFRKLYENKFYSQKFSSFLHDYPISAISLKIAEQYYLKAESIRLHSTINYKQRADLYTEGLRYGNYKDIEAKALLYRKEYATRHASELYQNGLAAEKSGEHKRASDYFSTACITYQEFGRYKDCEARATKNDKIWRTKAAEAYQQGIESERLGNYQSAYEYFSEASSVYSPYGAYKDSEHRAVQNDKKWRAELAENEFNRALNIASDGRKHSYREAAAIFQTAYEHYQLYGDYRNASDYAKKYAAQGNIEYGLRIRSGNSKHTPDFSIENIISSKLSASYYRKSSRPKDLQILVDYNYQCTENQHTNREPQSWQDEKGNIRYYTALKTTHHGLCTVKGNVSTEGLFARQYPFTVKAESSGDAITYEGDLPKNIRSSDHGSAKSLRSLKKEVERKMQAEIQDAASAIRSRSDQM